MKKTVHVGTIKGIDILMNRSGKANRNDDDVKRGVGIHIPSKYKTKTKQKIKNRLREEY